MNFQKKIILLTHPPLIGRTLSIDHAWQHIRSVTLEQVDEVTLVVIGGSQNNDKIAWVRISLQYIGEDGLYTQAPATFYIK